VIVVVKELPYHVVVTAAAILGTGVAVTILAAVVIAASIVDNRSFAAF
jgi:hypothetical protein